MKFWKYVDTQEQARHSEVEALLNEIVALQKDYDKLLEKFVILTAKEMQRKEKALVVVKQKIGFDLGGSNEK